MNERTRKGAMLGLAAAGMIVVGVYCQRAGDKGAMGAREQAPAAIVPALGGHVQDGVENRFFVHEVPVVPCAEGQRCVETVLVDTRSGEREIVADLEFPPDTAGASLLKKKLLAGELVAIGAVQQRSRVDETEGRAPAEAGSAADGGKAYEYARVLVVRDTAGPGRHESAERVPRSLLVVRCDGRLFNRLLGDDSYLYFDRCDSVERIRKDGGGVTTLLRKTEEGLAIDDANVYAHVGAHIVRVPKSGGDATVLDGGCAYSRRFFVDQQSLYCQTSGPPPDGGGPDLDFVVRMPKTGGGPETRIAAYARPLDLLGMDGDSIYFGHSVFVPGSAKQFLYGMSKSGGAPRIIAESSGTIQPLVNPRSLFVAGDDVYWANWCGGCFVSSAPKKGGGRVVDHASVEKLTPEGVFVQGDDLYFTAGDGQVLRTPKSEKGKVFPPGVATGSRRGLDTLYADDTWVYALRTIDARTQLLVRQPR